MANIVKYFSMADALKAPINSKTVFVIANERNTKSGHIGRYYTIFSTFKDFLANRKNYPHCHEVLVDHENNKLNLAGRLVFDFDIKLGDETDDNAMKIPTKFKLMVENTVVAVVEKYFHDVDTGKFEFIWSSSENPKKVSKHLTVKNLYFDNWINMSRTFYQLFCIIWDESYLWINSSKLIDFQIVRNRASLRMVGSNKIGGYPLILDNKSHKLTDSLIRIYFRNQRLVEQLVTKDNIIESVFNYVLNEPESESERGIIINFNPRNIEKPAYDQAIYNKAYELYNTIHPGIFKAGKINGALMSMIRIKPNKCLMSGKLHEQENAFLIINKDKDTYLIRFGCYRFCHKKKTIYIGSLTIDNLVIMIEPNLEPKSKKPRKKKPSIVDI